MSNARTGKAAQAASHSTDIRRMVGLETAVKMLGGQAALAAALDIDTRSLRAKMTADRGVSARDLDLTASALVTRAQQLIDHAAKLRELVSGA